MLKDTFLVRVFSPLGLLIEEQVKEAIVPGIDGQLGFLPSHVNYTGILGTGILSYGALTGGHPKKFVVSGGFCSFEQDLLNIVADDVNFGLDINLSDLKTKIEGLSKTASTLSQYDSEWERINQEIKKIDALLQLK